MFLADQMPDIRQYEQTAQKVQALYEYMYSLRGRLNHVLSNLDEENLSDEFVAGIRELRELVDKNEAANTVRQVRLTIWPVGSVWMTTAEDQDPAKVIGGKWERIEGAPMTGVTAWKRTE